MSFCLPMVDKLPKRTFKINFKNLIVYLAVLAAFITMFIFNHRTVFIILMVVQLLCLIPSFILLNINFTLPDISLKMDRNVQFVNEKNDLLTVLSSDSFYPFSRILIKYDIYHSFESGREHHLTDTFSLFKSKKSYSYSVSFDYCGVYVVSASEIKIFDLLNIFYVLAAPAETNAIVMPKVYLIVVSEERLGITKEEEDQNDPSKGYDVSEIKELREYRDGDRLSQIHWKLSTKSMDLIVKEYERLAGTCILIACDGSINSLSEINDYYDLLISFGTALISEQLYFEIMYFDKRDGDYRRIRIDNTYDLEITIQNMYYGMSRVSVYEMREHFKEHSHSSKLMVLTGTEVDEVYFEETISNKTFKIYAEK